MFSRKCTATSPDSFPFPFQPYPTQDQFMRALYEVIENGKVGLFESPTGTGKTLSILCGALKWQNDNRTLSRADLVGQLEHMEATIKQCEEETAQRDNWLTGQYDTIQKKQQLNDMRQNLHAWDEYEQMIEETRRNWQNNALKKAKHASAVRDTASGAVENVINEDDDLVLEDKDSDDDDDDVANLNDVPTEEKYRDLKIFFCSRTHSQLSQAINELKKTVYQTSTRVVQLASRQQLCIFPEVQALKSNAVINERCLELKKGGKSTATSHAQKTAQDENGRPTKRARKMKQSCSCPYYNQTTIQNVANSVLFNAKGVMDIEELVAVGRKEKGCPYYAARAASKTAQVIMLPYQMILHKSTREQMDIDIADNVIIIDEAHNLLDAIANIHSAEITSDQLNRVLQHLSSYKLKYMDRFSTKNLLRLNQLISIASRLGNVLKEQPSKEPGSQASGNHLGDFLTKMVLTHSLLDDTNISYGSLFEILKFCADSNLARKLSGFVSRYGGTEIAVKKTTQPKKAHKSYLQQLSEKSAKDKKVELKIEPTIDATPSNDDNNRLGTANYIRLFLSFLERLLEKSTDGRVLISKHRTLQSKSFMKYLLLNVGEPFEAIAEKSRAVILAGGTMQPTIEFKSQLFQKYQNRIEEHFYGHVASNQNIAPMIVNRGPANTPFMFNYSTRQNTQMTAELAMLLCNICSVVPGGVVCFFTSYQIMDQFHEYLIQSKTIDRIQKKKIVFKEPRNGQETEQTLTNYAKAIRSTSKPEKDKPTGAFMLSVVGGKLSEGLNFSNDLCRCVCIIGLPFPNKTNPELAEKLAHLDRIAAKGSADKTPSSCSLTFSSREYYENLCMKAVNQCIGRAIRHANDYSVVLLIDERYQQEHLKKKLPAWICASLTTPINYGSVQGGIVKFFRSKSVAKVNDVS